MDYLCDRKLDLQLLNKMQMPCERLYGKSIQEKYSFSSGYNRFIRRYGDFSFALLSFLHPASESAHDDNDRSCPIELKCLFGYCNETKDLTGLKVSRRKGFFVDIVSRVGFQYYKFVLIEKLNCLHLNFKSF